MKNPKIRFKGCTDDWEQRKVSELCSISTGKSNTQDKVEDGEYPFYVRSPIIERSTKYLYDEEAVLTVGDGVGTGKVFHYVNGKYDLHQRCYRMYDFTDTLNARYFYHTFSKFFYKRVMAMTAKTSVDSVRLEMIADMEIPCPDINEQEQIGAFFTNIDHFITLHQRKCEETKKLKKYMLQKMFPKDGATVPEIRFAGFTDDWEQRKLEDVLERRIEQRQQSEEYPRLAFASGQGVIPLSERKTNNREQLTKDEFTKKYLVTELDDIVYNPANVKYGAIDRNKCGRGLISPIYVTFITSEIPGFIERIVTSHDFQQRALKFEEGTVTKRQSVNPEDFVTIDILIAPQREEQRKISEYFDALDHLITLHQRKCDELRNIKRFMLQNMFV